MRLDPGLKQLLGTPGGARRALLELEKLRCEESLIEFATAAWPHVGESGEFAVNWHHEVIAEYLEAMARGEIPSMIVNQPPRTTKTLLCSVFWPAWIWAQREARRGALMGPHVKFLCISYGATLAEEIAVKMRRLVLSEWYQERWGDQVEIRDDQSSRDNFGNTAGGERISNSIEGGILGKGGDVQILDDLHHTKGAESEAMRRSTLEGMRALVTRVTDPRRTARLLVCQRLHQDDATNYAVENWSPPPVHLMFPMRYDAARAVSQDVRREEGELLWPEVWSEAVVAAEERELLEYGTASQLQQSPIPKGGGIIKRDWFRLWPDDAPEAAELAALYRCSVCRFAGEIRGAREVDEACPSCGSLAKRVTPYPEMSFRLLTVDTAYAESETASYSAALGLGIWHGKDDAPRVMLTDAWRGRPRLRGDPAATEAKHKRGLVEIVYDLAVRRRCDLVLIERKTRGEDLYNELSRIAKDWPFALAFTEPTGQGSKTMRLESCVGLFTAELVWAPNLDWAETVIAEVTAAPFGQYWDLTDCLTGGLRYFRDSGMLLTAGEHRREERAARVFRGRGFDAAEMYGL